MQRIRACLAGLSLLSVPVVVANSPSNGSVSGRVTYTGTPPKPKTLDMSKDPACVKLHPDQLLTESVVTGPANSLKNVVVYISAGGTDMGATVSEPAAIFDQKGCHYTTHVLPLRIGQDVRISNSDALAHNIHPLAKINREWNRIQLPGTPPFTYSYETEEFIPVKCNIHPWMQAYFVVLRTRHFAVTGDSGGFDLSDLQPGRYIVTAWHETYGSQSREITIGTGETQTVDFVFQAKS
jgi:Carboxypeptidase regulatory-like domain